MARSDVPDSNQNEGGFGRRAEDRERDVNDGFIDPELHRDIILIARIFRRGGWDPYDPNSTLLFGDILYSAKERQERRKRWAGLRQPVMIVLITALVGWVFGNSALSQMWSLLLGHIK